MKEPRKTISNLSNWLRDQVETAGLRGAVVGVSGGIDSAVALALCKQALGDQVLALIMPCESPPEDLFHAKKLVESLEVNHRIIDLAPVFKEFLSVVTGSEENRSVNGNVKARLRMTTLYYYANLESYMVIGTGNQTELAYGYFTKHGDGGVDLLPLGGLLKKEVYEIGRLLQLPKEILEKPPSAGLWPGQTDEGELGFTYAILDDYLQTGEALGETKRELERLKRLGKHKGSLPLRPPETLIV